MDANRLRAVRVLARYAASKLPEGPPSGRGTPLDSDLPGTKTFSQPSEQNRYDKPFDGGDEESLHRTDDAHDLLTTQKGPEINDVNADKHWPVGNYGLGDWDASSMTRYPYRLDYKTEKNASKVILGHHRSKIAVQIGGILEGLNPKFRERGSKCVVETERMDPKNLRWILSVDCGNGPKVVRVKGFKPSKNVTSVSKMDLDVSCSCKAWQWLGPEHHSKREDYLDGDLKGTATPPKIKDPTGVNRVCKHVYAVLVKLDHISVGRQKKK